MRPEVHPSRFSLLGSCSGSVRSSNFEVRFGVLGSGFGVRSSAVPSSGVRSSDVRVFLVRPFADKLPRPATDGTEF